MARPPPQPPRRRPREWSSLVAALRDPARSDFAFVPHQYVFAPSEFALATLSPGESTPINSINAAAFALDTPVRLQVGVQDADGCSCVGGTFHAQANSFFWLHVVAIALACVCCAWLSLFPIAPNRLYNMQVDIFSSSHSHTAFYYQPCLYLGAIFGAAGAGYLGDRLGRAGTLELASVPYVLGWLLHSVAYGEITVLLGRYLLGVATGMMCVVVPIYVAEISAVRSRGRLVCLLALLTAIGYACYVGVGMLFVFLSHRYFGFSLSEWKALALVGVLPGVVLLLLMQRLPDSPTWLVARHDDREAAFDVIFHLFSRDSQRAESEVNRLIHASVVACEQHDHHGAFFRPLWLCCALFVLRAITASLIEPTLSSAATTLSFSVTVFGVGVIMSDIMQLTVLFVLLLASVVGILCCFFVIDVRGRSMALQSGCTLVILGCLLLLVSAYHDHHTPTSTGRPSSNKMQVTDVGSAALLLITAGYQLGLGIGPVVMLGELFPTRQRVGAASIVIMAEAFTRLAMAFVVPLLRELLSFSDMFVAMVNLVLVANAIGVVVAWFYLPETSQRSLQAIEAILSGWHPETPQMGQQSRVRLGRGSAAYGT